MPTWGCIRTSLQAAAGRADQEHADASDLSRETIAARMTTMREQLVCWILPRIILGFLIVLGSLITNSLRQTNRWLSQEQDLIIVFGFTLLVFWQRCTRMSRALGPTILLSLLLFISTAWTITAKSRGHLFLCSALSVGPRLVFSVIFMRVRPTICWHVFHFVALLFVYTRVQPDGDGRVDLPAPPLFELQSTMLLIFCLVGFQRMMVTHIKTEIQFAETKNVSSAVISLLNTVCDASVELDENLAIRSDAARLGAMLLHTSGRGLEGVEFSKLLSSAEDREKFARHACARANMQHQECSLADLFNVHVRDNTNNDVEVEIFLVSYSGFSGRTKFVVGIREKATDAVISQSRELLEVRFEAKTFKVIGRSSSFDLRGPSGSCEPGDCLRQWLPPCETNILFSEDFSMALRAVEHSNESFSFTSTIVLQNLVKPGTAYVAGHRFIAKCSVHLKPEDVAVERRESTDRGDAAIIGLQDVSKQRSTIATMRISAVNRLRTCRQSDRKPRPRVTTSL
eukprot:TRINITY_DN2950_c1_g1_i4.p1 TRINITY_DN2950_c1_g1~~TRINITY_DN2950_c1_g1_i4.p1  ORF type:complete len:571 (-),score=47.64 TRINITY_DN2950_c1_g1_i4:67-1605(-)